MGGSGSISDIRLIQSSATSGMNLGETRGKILDLLKIKDMTISQIAEALDRDQSTIYRHIKKLEESEFIEVVGEKRKHHVSEKVYGRTADWFLVTPEPLGEEKLSLLSINWNEEKIKVCLDNLDQMGIEFEYDEETIEHLREGIESLEFEVIERMVSNLHDHEIEDEDFFELLCTKLLAMFITAEIDDSYEEFLKEISSKFELSEY